MLIAIVLDRPLAETKALVEAPDAFIQAITRIMQDKQNHPVIAQMIRPGVSDDLLSRSLYRSHCFDHFFGPCFRGHDEAGLLAFSMSLFSDVGPLETIAENKTEQKSAAKRRQRLLKAALKPPSYDARFPTARSV